MNVMEVVDRLAELEPVDLPFISLYVSTTPDDTGRMHYEASIKKELHARARTFHAHSPARASYDRNVERILAYLRTAVDPSANGVAIFACAAASDFFEAVQLPMPLDRHQLFVDRRPHLYPLARLHDQYRRYAVVVADAHTARVLVFGSGEAQRAERIDNDRTVHRNAAGGWSQARYQRRMDNFQAQHAREVVETLGRVVREDHIEQIVLAGDEPMLSILRDALPKPLAERVIDEMSLDANAPDHEVFATTLAAVRVQDAITDAEKVERLVNEYRGGGLAVVGLGETLTALSNGQVDEVLLAGRRAEIKNDDGSPAPAMADELIVLARQTSARVTIIEDPALLDEIGGVGALLRYRIDTGRAA
jgi:peptide subunit release factor 1 (eRF1)